MKEEKEAERQVNFNNAYICTNYTDPPLPPLVIYNVRKERERERKAGEGGNLFQSKRFNIR